MSIVPWPDLIGSSYVSESKYAAVERTDNWYLEVVEVPEEKKTRKVLYPRPRLASYGINPPQVSGRARGLLTFNNFAWGVNGTSFYVLQADGSQIAFGTVIDDGNPVTMCANSSATYSGNGQIAIASAGNLYIYSGGVFSEIPNDGINFFGASSVTFLDGYFIVVTPDSSQFQISALNDGTTWDGADVAILEGQADGLVNAISDKEYLYLIGGLGGGGRTELWYNSGNALFPFTIEQGAFMEVGIGPMYSLCQGDPESSTNCVYWVAQSARGGGSAWKVVGLNPQRISTYAVESQWAKYSTISDCICYSLRWQGHMLVRYIFPTADKSWQYDATVSAQLGYPCWSVLTFTDANGLPHATLERCHAYQYGRHIVSSGGAEGGPGVAYQLARADDGSAYYDADNPGADPPFVGFPIIRRRTCPHLFNGNKRDIYNMLDLGMEFGAGLDGGVQGSNPQVVVTMSRDGGKNFGTERVHSMGRLGEFAELIRFYRWGQARDCVYDIQVSDPVFSSITNAEIDVTAGSS